MCIKRIESAKKNYGYSYIIKLNWSGKQSVTTRYIYLRLNANGIFYSKMYKKILIRKSIEKEITGSFKYW